MIGFFPAPYPDELLYSICARYNDAVQYPTKEAINKELFESTTVASVGLPCRLGHLVSRLPLNSTYTVAQIIDNHTLLPFYSPFISPSRISTSRAIMKASNGWKVGVSTGIWASSIQPPLWLRFCPACADADKKQWGEYYWHRLHQVSGVNVCIKHRTLLADSAVHANVRHNETAYVSAEIALRQLKVTLPTSRDAVHSTLLGIARDAAWLLRQRNLMPGLEVLHSCYVNLLASRGLTTTWGRTRGIALTRELNKAYGLSLLKALQCEADERKCSNWVRIIVNGLTRDKVNHPLRHLLLMRFLGHTAESFFTSQINETRVSIIERKAAHPFGPGPYPCLNPVCKNFRLPIITTCQVSRQNHVLMADGTHPRLGTFSCECGFSYCRREFDLQKLKKFEFSFVRDYGHVWEMELARLWGDKTISLRRIATTLRTATHSLKRKAAGLGLLFPRQTTRVYIRAGAITFPTHLNSQAQSYLKEKREKAATRRAANRKKWLSILESNPTVTHRWLRDEGSFGIYLWLLKHDKEWLAAHRPDIKNTAQYRRNVNWAERDRLTAEEVRRAILRLSSMEGRPKRITVAAIAFATEGKARLSKFHLGKLPVTARLVSEAVESRYQFALRCLRWATGYFRGEGVAPSRTKLLTRTGGERNIWKSRPLKDIFESTWRCLQETEAPLSAEAA